MKFSIFPHICALGLWLATALVPSYSQTQQPTPAQIRMAKEMLKNDPALKNELLGETEINPDTAKKALDSTLTRSKLSTFSTDTIDFFNDNYRESKKADSLPGNQETDSKKLTGEAGLTEKPLERYGMYLFSQEAHVQSVSDVPEDYVIVPGDQILLRLWGRYNLEKIYTVGDDGYVFIDPLNKQTYLKGMTHKRVKQMIRTIVGDMAGVEGEAKVISTHPLKVNVSGEAKVPGTILIPPFFTFWQALKLSQGPSKDGSLRDIRLVRDGKIVYKLDIYDYLKTGTIPSLAIQENDLIFFGPLENSVTVKGGTKKTAIFEIKKSENFGDLIKHAGGFNTKAISPVLQIERILPIEQRTAQGDIKTVIDVNVAEKGWEKQILMDGDVVTSLTKVPEFLNTIYLEGNGIKVPGRYSLTSTSSTLGAMIAKAGGMNEGYHPTFEVVRKTPVGKRSIYIKISALDELNTVNLEKGDSILTYHENDFVDSTTIMVTGFVRDSVQIFYTENLSLQNVIQRAGGLKDGGLPYVYVKRTDEFHNIQYEKVNLADAGDYILKKRDHVFAFGYYDFNKNFPVIALMEGKEPLFLDYSDNLSLEVIIHQLGGLLPNLDSSRVEINSPEFNSNETYVQQKTVPLSEANLKNTELIVAGSMIIFRNDAKKQAPGFVHLIGEFNNPGRYALRSTKESFNSILQQAGGLTNRANPYSISIHRVHVEKPLPIRVESIDPLDIEGEWLLTNGDSVFIRRNDFMVTIEGAVLNPSVIQWTKSYDWKDYVNSGAGGALDTADIKRTYVIYPNGVTVKAKKGWLSSSEIYPGSKIIVPFKPYTPPKVPKEPISTKEFVALMATTVSMIAAIITAYAIYYDATKNP